MVEKGIKYVHGKKTRVGDVPVYDTEPQICKNGEKTDTKCLNKVHLKETER